MRICSPQLGVAPDASLGGEVYDRETLKHMALLGAEIEILLPAGLPCPDVKGWRVTRMPLRRGYRWFVSNAIFVPYIGRAYRSRPFDVLRVHSLRFTGLAALWARTLFRLPVPVVAHHHHLDRDRWTDVVDRRVAQSADMIITGSDFSRQQLMLELGAPAARTVVTNYGVHEMFQPGKRGEDGGRDSEEDLMILHVGSLKARKNLPLLLEAFAEVLSQVPRARLQLIGLGPDEKALRKQVKQMDLQEVVCFAGFLSETEKLNQYRRADVLVSASTMEGFGLAVAEAMACGLPVVATSAGALPELLDKGAVGLLVPANDVKALSAAIVKVLLDSQLAGELARAGQERVKQHYRWPVTAERTLALYEALL